MGLFDELPGGLSIGAANMAVLKRELESRRSRYVLRPGDLYRGAGDYLLRHGEFFTGRRCPDEYAQYIGPNGECFNNAMLAAEADPGLRYFEGLYAAGGDHPTAHAWCVDPDGEVVELTWITREDQGLGSAFYHAGAQTLIGAPEHVAYCGVELDPALIRWFAYERADEFCLLDRPDYDADINGGSQEHDFEILRHPYDKTRREFPSGSAPTP